MIERNVLVWNEAFSSIPDDKEDECEEGDDDAYEEEEGDEMIPTDTLELPTCNWGEWSARPDAVRPLVEDYSWIPQNQMHAPHGRTVPAIVRNHLGAGGGRPTERLIPPVLNFDSSVLTRKGY